MILNSALPLRWRVNLLSQNRWLQLNVWIFGFWISKQILSISPKTMLVWSALSLSLSLSLSVSLFCIWNPFWCVRPPAQKPRTRYLVLHVVAVFFKVFVKEWRWEPYLNVITKLLCSVLLCCLTIHLFPTVQEACKSGSVTLLQVQTCWCPTHCGHRTSMLVRSNRSLGDLSSLEHKTRPHMLWFSPTRVLDMKHSWNDFASANFINAMLAQADQNI